MNTKKNTYKWLSTAMVIHLMMPTSVLAAEKVSKEETVYVELDSVGNTVDKISSIWLHSEAPLHELKDKSTLKNVVNVKGDEEPTIKNDELNWSTEEKELYYQGNPTEDLPLKVNIQYFLNDQKVVPEDIIGKSGKLKMKIRIENTDVRTITLENGEKRNVYTPYLVGTTVNLATDKFENIELNTGRLVSDASHQVAGFVSLPGLKESLNLDDELIDLPDHLELTADVEDFEIPSLAIVAKSELPEMEDLELSEDLESLMDGIDQMMDAGLELTNGTGDLATGQVELDHGINQLDQGIQQIKEGTNALSQGTLKLNEGMNSAYSASKEISKGAQLLADNSEKLSNAYVELADGTIQFSQKSLKLSEGVNQLGEKVATIPGAAKQLNQGMSEVVTNMESIYQGQTALTSGLNETKNGITQIKNGKAEEAQGIESLRKNTKTLEALVSQLEEGETKEQLRAAIAAQKQGLEGISASSQQLVGALEKVESGMNNAAASSEQLAKGSKEINQGQAKISEGLTELQKGTEEIPAATKQFEQASQQLSQASGQIKEKSLEAKKAAGQFTNGSAELAQGSNQLSNGISELKSGSHQLNQGLGELSSGANELAGGSDQLKDGSSQLVEGTNKLNDGMNEFYEEGIEKIHSKVDNSDLDLAGMLEVKDELIQLSKENDSFSGKSEEMDGDLKYIMKSENVTEDEEVEEIETEEDTNQNKGFINWLKSLFNK